MGFTGELEATFFLYLSTLRIQIFVYFRVSDSCFSFSLSLYPCLWGIIIKLSYGAFCRLSTTSRYEAFVELTKCD